MLMRYTDIQKELADDCKKCQVDFMRVEMQSAAALAFVCVLKGRPHG